MGPKVSLGEHNRVVDEYESMVAELREEIAELATSAEPADWLEKALTRRILVHTTAGPSIEGSLVAQFDDGLCLRAAKLLPDSGGATSLAGEVFIPRGQVLFAQLQD